MRINATLDVRGQGQNEQKNVNKWSINGVKFDWGVQVYVGHLQMDGG